METVYKNQPENNTEIEAKRHADYMFEEYGKRKSVFFQPCKFARSGQDTWYVLPYDANLSLVPDGSIMIYTSGN